MIRRWRLTSTKVFKPHGFSTSGDDRVSTFKDERFATYGDNWVQLIGMTGFQLMGMTGFLFVGMTGFQLKWIIRFQLKEIRGVQQLRWQATTHWFDMFSTYRYDRIAAFNQWQDFQPIIGDRHIKLYDFSTWKVWQFCQLIRYDKFFTSMRMARF